VVELTVKTAAGRVPVFGGCTHNATSEAVARAKRLAKTPGLTGILTANPYYNRPGQEGQYSISARLRRRWRCRSCCTTFRRARREPGAGDGAAAGGDQEHHRR